jgi:hypothetical protein
VCVSICMKEREWREKRTHQLAEPRMVATMATEKRMMKDNTDGCRG